MKLLRQSTINISAGVLLGITIPLLLLEGIALKSSLESAVVAADREKELGQAGEDMRKAADFLVGEARAYAVTGERARLDAFWREVLVDQRRERCLERLAALGATAEETRLLRGAKEGSDALLETEILSMRLVAESGPAMAGLPEPLAEARLPPPFAALSPEGKAALARELVFGQGFMAQERAVLASVDEFQSLAGKRSAAETAASREAARRSYLGLLAIGALAFLSAVLVVSLYYFAMSLPIRRYIAELAGPEPGSGMPELQPSGTLELIALAAAFNDRRLERLRSEAALRDSERRYRTHLRLTPLGAVDNDAENRIVSWNPAAERIFGYSEAEALGRNIIELLVPSELRPEIEGLVERLNQGEVISTHTNRNVRKDGTEIICEWYSTPFFDSAGAWVGWASIIKDITEQRREAERILYLSRHDPLTGLLNRRSLMEKIEEERVRCARTGEGYALIMLDIDRFKGFNDRYGHECGDVVLKAVARAMRETVRSTDSVGRWGGEEFLVLLPATDAAGGLELAEKIRARVASASVECGGASRSVRVTAGATGCGPGEASADEGIRRADAALLHGKRQGRDRAIVVPRPGEEV